MIVADEYRSSRYITQLGSRQCHGRAITGTCAANRLSVLLDSAYARRAASRKNAHDLIDCEIAAPDRPRNDGPRSLDRERPVHWQSEQVVRFARVSGAEFCDKGATNFVESCTGAARATHYRLIG